MPGVRMAAMVTMMLADADIVSAVRWLNNLGIPMMPSKYPIMKAIIENAGKILADEGDIPCSMALPIKVSTLMTSAPT